MKVLMINTVCGIRSTGRICTDLATEFEANGHEVKIAYGREYVPGQFQKYAVKIESDLNIKLNAVKARIFDNEGFNAKLETSRFLEWADIYDPDILWLHNLHGYYINVEQLFAWIKARPKMKVKWTLHDCWAFTGHCAYYSFYGCEKWQTACYNCPLKSDYPRSFFADRSQNNYKKKKQIFTGVKDLTIIVPSFWMKNQVEKSFLNRYPIEVVYNQIDIDTFVPTISNFKDTHNLNNKKVVLGVAAIWDKRKGLDDFIALSKELPSEYKIVLVGLSERQIKKMPKEIVPLGKIDSKKELAEIYSAADIFLNPSKEETFGLTTLEAASCGAKCIVLKGTACEEVAELFSGIVVDNSIDAMKRAILSVGDNKPFKDGV